MGLKQFWVNKILGLQKFGSTKILCPKFFEFCARKTLKGLFGQTKIWSKNFVIKKIMTYKNWSKLDQEQLRYSWYGQMLPVQMLLGQILPWQLASVKGGQNRVRNSWDIPDMDKHYVDKCCLEKCHFDSWNMFKMVQGAYV